MLFYLQNSYYLCRMITKHTHIIIAVCLSLLTLQVHAQHVTYRSFSHYNKRVAQFEREGGITSKSIVMLGNSLTENGKDWSQRLGNENVVNRGIIGDNTTGMKERLCQITPYHPQAIFLMAGINNMVNDAPVIEVAQQVIGLIEAIREQTPQTKLFVESLLPINEKNGRWHTLANRTNDIPLTNMYIHAYCESHGIQWVSCPGCNAQAVCDYIEEALEEVHATGTIGIVGVGHVGSLVAKMAERRGLKVLLNDPPKKIGVSLDFSASKGLDSYGFIGQNCDIITFHTPLTKDGKYPTFHLCDEHFLSQCKPNALIINAARGGVVDEQALLRSGHPYILDTWENEPHINQDVLQHALRASMHIAGYSVQGKRNASQMCLDAIADLFGLKRIEIPTTRNLENSIPGDSSPGWLSRISDTLKANPADFESLRKSYPLRGE